MEEAIKPNGLALLVVDMQPGFLKAIPDRDRLVSRCQFAVKAARLLEIPVAFTEQVPAKLGSTIELLSACAEDATVFAKDEFSALRASGIQDWLSQNEVRHLLLCGIEIPICIYQTLVDAARDRLPVSLLSDCVGARRADDATSVLDFIRARLEMHVVVPSEALFYSILGSARHPLFRDFTKLVKEAIL